MTTPSNKVAHLAASASDHHSPACAFFHNREAEYRLLLPFVDAGFQHGDKLFQIVDGDHHAERLGKIAGLGIAAAERSGRREVRAREDAHSRERRVDQFAMLDLLEDVPGKGNAAFGGVVACTYDLAKFNAAVMLDVLRIHPQVISSGIRQENPFYLEPEKFLSELRARRATE
jgi:MEDS: MEthanogen/methylotroph, DcmR Sensory domain